jgi:ATP-dependent exoDNAse (exonuclease V) beta subunit
VTAIDQPVRDRAIHEVTRSFAMSAGAGSGKTSVLSDRVVQLLLSGVDPGRVAAITFTEKAAGELQERVRDALEAAAASDPSEALSTALRRLPELQLSTIHAFCQRLLTLEALEAGWAPGTEVMGAALQSDGVAKAYRSWLQGFRSRQPAAARLVGALVNPATLRSAAAELVRFRDLTPVTTPLSLDARVAFGQLLEVHQGVIDAAAGCKAPDTDKLLAGNAGLLRALEQAVQLPPGDTVVRTLLTVPDGKRSGGRKGDWVAGGKQTFLEALDALGDWRTSQLERLHGTLVRDLHTHFLPEVERAKSASAVADFDDLLFRAGSLLEHDEVRRRLARRFDALLVDEVQDTDPIQARVAALLTRDPEATGAWNAHGPQPGRLFAVGDPRQSIYRFRRADVATFDALSALVQTDGEALSLSQNFRSVPGLVDWVNRCFASLPGYVPQRAYRQPAALPPVVRLSADDELQAVARYLHHLRRVGQVVDRTTGERREVRWGDVMVLLPAWTKADALCSGLARAGIPALVEGGGGFFERDEVTLCVAALHALEEPGDERRTVRVLRGLFGIDFEQLATHRAAGGSWRYTVPEPPPGPVADAFTVLSELGRMRGRRPWVDLLDDLLDRTAAPAVWAAMPDGDARLANLDKLRALLRQAESTSTSSGQVLRRLDELDTQTDLSRNDLDSDAVRITSYFKAKGLEAPVVVLCYADRGSPGASAAVDRERGEVALRITPLSPPDWDRRKADDKADDEAERARWMYVAATRARDQLVIVQGPKSKLLTEHLGAALAEAEAVDVSALPEVPLTDETFRGVDEQVDAWLATPAPPVDGSPEESDDWVRGRSRALRRSKAACTSWRSVHELAARERVARAASPVGVVGGRVVHEVMEQLDLALPAAHHLEELPARVAGAAVAAGLSEEVEEACVDILRGLVTHPVMERARQAPERWVEVPFALHDQGRVVSGRIDLAFPTDASRRRWVVVDWKSDLPARGTAAWRNYERQLGWYAKALLQTVSPCEEVETVLVGPHPSLGDGPSAAERVAQVLPELAPALAALLDEGVEVPRVGADVGEPIVALAELAFDAAKVALCIDPPDDDVADLRSQGWTVVVSDGRGVSWAERAMQQVRKALPR